MTMRRFFLPLIGLLLASCGSATLRQPFRSYNRAYADALNEQMLLNLARLHNGHPPYFLAIGTINNRYTFSGEATGGGNWSNTDSTSQSNTQGLTTASNYGQLKSAPEGVLGMLTQTVTKTLGATAGAATSALTGGSVGGKLAATNSPDFQLIPLNNDIVAKQFLEPISTEVFFTLYQQGCPMDQLLRVLVERIETTLPNKENVVLVNSPTGGTAKSFARFLRVCALLHEMQHSGALLMDIKSDNRTLGVAGEGWKVTGKDLLDAHDKKLSYRTNAEGVTELVQEVTTPTFYLRPGASPNVKAHLYESNVTDDHEAIDRVVDLLSKGIVVKNKTDPGQTEYTRLVLRSYSRAMEAAATEQDGFDALMKKDEFTAIVPVCEQRPVLRTVWSGQQQKLRDPLQAVQYAGQTYQVTDPVVDPLDSGVRWNRDVFRLLVGLGSQVSVDISKFQRQILELR
jgi:hypothetical protein